MPKSEIRVLNASNRDWSTMVVPGPSVSSVRAIRTRYGGPWRGLTGLWIRVRASEISCQVGEDDR